MRDVMNDNAKQKLFVSVVTVNMVLCVLPLINPLLIIVPAAMFIIVMAGLSICLHFGYAEWAAIPLGYDNKERVKRREMDSGSVLFS